MRLARRTVASGSLPPPRFRYAPVVAAGPFVFVSGLVGLDPAGPGLVAGGAYAEAVQILRNLVRLAEDHGWSIAQLIVARIYCADFSKFGEVNRAWDEAFEGIEPPARTSVGVAALPLGAQVEMEFQFLVEAAA